MLGERFEDLLGAWRRHHDLSHSGASLEERWEARLELESARDQVYRLRRALAPRPDERVNSAMTVVCPELEAPVVVPWQDVVRDGNRMLYWCPCGDRVVGEHRPA